MGEGDVLGYTGITVCKAQGAEFPSTDVCPANHLPSPVFEDPAERPGGSLEAEERTVQIRPHRLGANRSSGEGAEDGSPKVEVDVTKCLAGTSHFLVFGT